jgi:DNA-binding transcriptional LysR family regulator
VCQDAILFFRKPPSKIVKMQLYQLRTFATVAELGSLTQAAERLHLSQPAASAQIKLLEQEFEFPLFERKPSGLTLTRAGAELLPDVQKLLASSDQVATHAKRLKGQVTGNIKFATLATLSDTSLLRLGEMLQQIVTRHSQLVIEVQHRNSRSIVAGVASGELDAGMALGREDIPNVSRIILKELRYRIVAPAKWGWDIRKASWKVLASKPWISTPKGGSHHQMAVQLFKRLGGEPETVIEADSEPVITGLVRAGLGLGLMREDLALAADYPESGIVVVNKGRPSTFLQVLHRTGRENDPAICAILAVLRGLWSDADAASTKHVSTTVTATRKPRAAKPPAPEQLFPFRGQRSAV